MSEPAFAYAHLNARVQPLERGRRYEEPLQAEFEKNRWGEVTGGGTMQEQSGEIRYCGLDIKLFDIDRAVPFICDFLEKRGAPKGSKLQYEIEGVQREVPFGVREGLAIYLNGTELPNEVYRNSDINHVFDEIIRLLARRGSIQSYWQGPTETAIYLYGDSVQEMKALIAPLMNGYPLCQRARYEVIA